MSAVGATANNSKFNDLVVPAYHKAIDLFFSGISKQLWMMGGRASIKSTVAGYLIPMGVMLHPGVSAMVLRAHGVDLKTSVYPNIKQCITWLAEKFPEQRLLERWRFREDCRFMTFDGNRGIVFHGLDDPTKRKSEKPPWGGYFGYLWNEELDEFDPDAVKSLRKSVLRGGPIGQSIYTYNPPKSKSAWVNSEAARSAPGKYVFKTTFLDVLPYHPEWLGQTFIEEAMAAKAENSIEWRWELMGEAIGSGGEVFNNVEAREITDEEIASFKERGLDRYGLDFGFTNDPTALIECAYDESKHTLYIYGAHGGYGMFEEDIADLIYDKGLLNKEIIADSAEPRAIAKLIQLGVRRVRKSWKAEGWVDTGLNFLRGSKIKIIIDPRAHRAKKAWDEFSSYEFGRYKNGDLKVGYPDKDNHWIDATRYALEDIIRAAYKPKVWSVPRGFERKFSAA
jgi:PBSX family phage terminase large subunit